MTSKKILFLFLALALPGFGQPLVTIGDIRWHTDYDRALKVAKKEQKPLWLHFGENPG